MILLLFDGREFLHIVFVCDKLCAFNSNLKGGTSNGNRNEQPGRFLRASPRVDWVINSPNIFHPQARQCPAVFYCHRADY